MKTYYLAFDREHDKDAMRKWIGRTSGISIAKFDEIWEETETGITWHDGYVLHVKHKKAEMMLLLQFPNATRQTERHLELQRQYSFPT